MRQCFDVVKINLSGFMVDNVKQTPSMEKDGGFLMQLATDTQSPPFSPSTTAPQESTVLGLTAKAMEKLLYFQETMPDASGKDFRVFVEGGGCSGFQYGYTFDEARSDDTIVDLGLLS